VCGVVNNIQDCMVLVGQNRLTQELEEESSTLLISGDEYASEGNRTLFASRLIEN